MMHYRIISRFLFRRFFRGVGLVLLIVCGIIFAVTFVERLPGYPTALLALDDAWARLVEYVPLFLPLAVFMGTLVTYYTLTRSSEGIIISGAGLSPYQMARPCLVGAFIIGVFATMVINPYAVELRSQKITSEYLKLVDGKIWVRDFSDGEYTTITAGNITKDSNNLVFHDVTIFVQDSEFKLTARIDTNTIELSQTGLNTNDANIFDTSGQKHRTSWTKQTNITPKTVLDRYLQPDQISFWELPGFIKKMSAVGVPIRGHMVQFWTLLFLPLSMIAMATLGVAFSQTRQRRNHSFGIKFGVGILTCFILYFVLNIFTILGTNGTLPPLLAVIAPPLIIIAATGVFIAGFDTI